MPSDMEQIETIRSQTLALLAELTAHPKPSYRLDGQTISWNAYLAKLRDTIDWCDRKLAGQTPFEIQSQGGT